MTSDLEQYREHIAELGLSDSHEAEVLLFLWRLADSAAAYAWGQDPVSSACGQVTEISPEFALTAPFDVECLDRLMIEHFSDVAGETAAGKPDS